MGYQQYGKKGDMPECLQKLVGGYPGELGQLEHIPEMMLERGKGRLSYNELELSYEIHQIPQNGEGAVEKLLY